VGLSLALGPSPPDAFDRGFGPGTSPSESLAPLLLGVPSSLYLRRVPFALVPGKGRSPLRCWRDFAETTSHSRPSLRCLRATASFLVTSRWLRTQAEGGSPNSSPSRLRMLFEAPEGSTIWRTKCSLKRHPSGVRAREDDLKICGVNKRVRPVGEVSLCFCFFANLKIIIKV